MRRWVLVAMLAGCDVALSEMDSIYSDGADRPVLCGQSVDNKNIVGIDSIAAGLERAAVENTLLHLYSHSPTVTVDESTIESVLAGAADRDLRFVTYRELVDVDPGARGLAFSFDDHDVVGWYGLRPMFERYNARVTFFISAFAILSEVEVGYLWDLHADGHAIEYHSTNHLNAEAESNELGVDAYVRDDILPGLEQMRAAGFDPKVFAYPFGARTGATDAALLEHFVLLRAIRYTCPY